MRSGHSTLNPQRSTLQSNSNIPLFIAFRVLFNARWYYPVMAVLFLDFGLSLGEYALLNVVWAAAIVGFDVPSGALADQIGRRRMMVLAASLMVVEMALFAFAPRGHPSLLFGIFVLNRLLSGVAEASASGADEALAYDSLAAAGRTSEWPAVLERQMRWQSAGFFVAMTLGAAVYDAGFVQKAVDFLGIHWKATHELTMRFPIYLTLANAVAALAITLRMKEPPAAPNAPAVGAALPAMLATGRWILRTPLALAVILGGLVIDSIVRLFLTIGSGYYRLIGLPEACFGLIGSGLAVLGFFTPQIARGLSGRNPMRWNFAIAAGCALFGLTGIGRAWPVYGLIFVAPLGIAMSFNQFFVSHYLNRIVADSHFRATILSFRGLAYNLAYGAVGLLFAALTRGLRGHGTPEMVFAESLRWLPWYFAGTLVVVAIVWRRLLRGKGMEWWSDG